jgi:hypothetical protein
MSEFVGELCQKLFEMKNVMERHANVHQYSLNHYPMYNLGL